MVCIRNFSCALFHNLYDVVLFSLMDTLKLYYTSLLKPLGRPVRALEGELSRTGALILVCFAVNEDQLGVTSFSDVQSKIHDRCFSLLSSDRKLACSPVIAPPSKVPIHSLAAPTPLLPVFPIYLFHGKNSALDKALHCIYVTRACSLVDRIERCIAGVVFGRLTASLVLVPKAHEDLIQAITKSQGCPFLFGEEYLHGKCLLSSSLPSR